MSADITPRSDPDEIKLAERIAVDNAEFQKATPAEKRVIIAKDLILQIELGMFVPSMWADYGIENLQGGCGGCALAGLLASSFDFGLSDRRVLLYGDCDRRMEITRRLSGVFSLSALALIEAAYEGNYIYATKLRVARITTPMWIAVRAERFGCRASPTKGPDRLIAILKNIIKNKGTFKP